MELRIVTYLQSKMSHSPPLLTLLCLPTRTCASTILHLSNKEMHLWHLHVTLVTPEDVPELKRGVRATRDRAEQDP